ncbi:Glycosyltransferase involved in cell wall bisynthesis [Halolactibacillus halophilus]|uniref:Glycosyltransferase involved in cell wall bisynthesis n=1 Tax=Halolactibacillus halophilus TaxID=306540 RepID=A0A1I5QES3_9BACI|nr:glycosyltransferase [Halolactibacillus halophilus]GEM02105.1 hypothetical protein HHA03_16370 [Halolactibacillus halophilus]SFP44814.1 Glycosyltransferase involved in cell wall bisynthesis [Halolactibacillus halophilus]
MNKVVMIVTNRYDPDIRVHKEALYLQNKGYQVEVLCWDRENDFVHRKSEKIDGISVERFFPLSKYGSGIRQLKSYIEFILEVKNYLKHSDYNYIHCHDLDGVVVGAYIKSSSSKLIFDMHEIYESQGSKRRIKYLIRFIVNHFQMKSDYIIYVNEIQKKISNCANKMIYLPNYPEKRVLGNIDKKHSENIRVSYIGSVRQFEEFVNLFEACKQIKKVKISIHGGGVAHKKLIELTSKYNNVKITGAYDISKLPDYYSEADLIYAVYSNKNEQHMNSYPVKFYESIVTKTPIIVSKGSVLEKIVIQEDIGFVVEGDNIDNIRCLIEKIAMNPEIIKQKVKSIENLAQKFTWEDVVNNLDYIYSGRPRRAIY